MTDEEYSRMGFDLDDGRDGMNDPTGRDIVLKDGQRAEILGAEFSPADPEVGISSSAWMVNTFGDREWTVCEDGTVLDDDGNDVGKVD